MAATSEPKMKLWMIKFPELDHLAPIERETLLRTALEGPEIKAFRSRVSIYIRILSVLITATIFVAIALDEATHLILLPILVVGTLLTMIGVVLVRVQIESRILRRALKQMLNAPRIDNA
jgi:hypothetical protein